MRTTLLRETHHRPTLAAAQPLQTTFIESRSFVARNGRADVKNQRLLSVCENKLMAISDAEVCKVITTVPIGAGTDGAAFDSGKHVAFSANGADGTITVVREVSPDKFEVADTIPTARGARTIAVDERSHHLFLPTAKFGATPAPTAERPRPRPSIEPGTFEVLEVSP